MTVKRAHLILFAGVFIASASSILIRMSDAHPLMVATYRMGFASLIMLPMALRGGLVRKLRALSPPKRYLIVLSGIALGLHFATWTSSLSYTTVAVSTVIVDSSPLFVLFFSYAFLDERMTRYGGAGLAVIFLGAVVIVYNELVMDVSLKGAFLALLGSISLASYLVIGRKFKDGMDTLSYVSLVYVVSFLSLLFMDLAMGIGFEPYGAREYIIFLLLAIGPSCLGHTSYNYSLRHFKASQVSASILCEPICASILALMVLGEVPTTYVLVGAGLIISGLFMVMEFRVRTKR